MATTSVNEVILEGPDQYHSWFSSTKGSVPEDLWEYFNPDLKTPVEFAKPELITFSIVKEGATQLQQLSSADKTLFTQLRTIYNAELTQYQRFLSEQAKLRKLITSTVSEAKKSQLRPDKSVREWIKNLQASTKPTDNQMQDIVRARHRVMMGAKYMEWPSGGPDKWITEWQKLMSDCERWCEPLYELWASDFNLVWGEVPGAQRLCDRLIEAVNKDDKKEANKDDKKDWDIFRASMELKQAWDQKSIRNGMRVAGRGRITKAAFAVEPRFNGIKASEDLIDEPQAAPSNSRKRPATENRQRYSYVSKRNKLNPCWGCGANHGPWSCLLIKGSTRRNWQIPDKNKKIFQEKMKNLDFAEKIRKIREVDAIKEELGKPKDD
jgi:hypothetical protein